MSNFKHFRVVEKKKNDGSYYYIIEYKKHRFFSYWRYANLPFKGKNEWKDDIVYMMSCLKFDNIDDVKIYCDFLNKYYKVICKGFYIYPVCKYVGIDVVMEGFCITEYQLDYDNDMLSYITLSTTDYIICRSESEINDTICKAIDIQYNKQYRNIIQ